MPRVQVKNTGRALTGRQPVCTSCGREIAPGEKRYEWAFRYAGKRVRCMAHPPRRSDLTASDHLARLYAAQEMVEDTISATHPASVQDLTTAIADLLIALEEAADVAQECTDAYREAADAFGGGGDNAERADEAEAWAEVLSAVTLDEPDYSEEQEDEDWDEKAAVEEAWAEATTTAQDAVNELAL